MKQIMLRHASDDFTALLTANGMTKAGAQVFSVTNNGPAAPNSFTSSHITDYVRPQKFIVWAYVEDAAHIDKVDKAIEKCLEEQKP
jgi:hypothetical protein